MDLGGPVWHASARAINEPSSWRMAVNALAGVGDAGLGEWRERGENGVMHLRRRLSDAERAMAGNLGVRDIRGTAEERARFTALFAAVPGLRAALRARGLA